MAPRTIRNAAKRLPAFWTRAGLAAFAALLVMVAAYVLCALTERL